MDKINRVKIINETKDINSNHENCLKYINEKSGKPVVFCSEANCIGRDLTGVIVQLANSNDSELYLVPLCKMHSVCTDEIYVTGPLVPGDCSTVIQNQNSE